MPGSGRSGYLLDVQADLLFHLATRTVVPLLPEAASPKPIGDLNPVFEIEGKPHVMVTQAIASISRRELKPGVASLAYGHDQIVRALDTLLVGF
jgi:toxin CcdB